ncbi:HAMP domain-containing sensor histidine kinase [Dyella jiangningensis]|uniref:histidine kinase n=1 Tax=Dyella jiangningensis TaxID=1379159 RepID=A0A328PCD3_9GAMM|nr:HAMP domain-containing sensor histidine kinase [Dyella jiangningensis]RAO77816.1 two-component sensor histidine kinase [Dyella jiangningensis]
MSPFKSSLYWRLLVSFCAVNLLALLFGGFLTQRFIEYGTAVEINWASLAQSANEVYENGGTGALAVWSQQQRREGIDATLYENGEALTPMRTPAWVRGSLQNWLDEKRDMVLQPWPNIYVAVQQVNGSDGRVRQLVALSRTHSRMRPQTRTTIFLASQAVLSLLFIGLVGWWVARSVARPVEAIRQATRRMASGELSARVGREGQRAHDELAQLARDFDAMAERIEALVTHDRSVLQDLSHELRSPLARLHLILDLAQRSDSAEDAARYFRQAEQEIGRLDHMTGEMLALSRLEGGIPGENRERIDVVSLLHDCIQRANVEAQARRIALSLVSSAPLMVSGSVLLLERAFDNLIANAIKFSPEGSPVELAVRQVDDRACCIVRDHGPGVPDAELSSLFRPLFRGSNASRAEGHGLGLAIAQRVARAHGGDIEARHAEGGGLQVELTLPLAPAVMAG